ncbi:MAG: hypothetical protein OXB84_05875 [Halobacteriovoraceae bacterium]|nr:hypothetical protein [Halobacteriovoraceae bacterium]
MIFAYRKHYIKSRQQYGIKTTKIDNFYNFQYEKIDPSKKLFKNTHQSGKSPLLLKLKPNYSLVINLLSAEIFSRFQSKENIIQKEELFLYIEDIYNVPYLEDVAQIILPQIEKNLFNSFCLMDGCYIYRNIYSSNKKHSSWIPHFDNQPKEIIKVMVYLSDVNNEQDAPICFLLKNGKGIKKESIYKDSFKNQYGSRISKKEMNSYINQGYSFIPFLGKKGTVIIFDNNLIHKATVPSIGKFRDAIVFSIRPWPKRNIKYINKETTRSFYHKIHSINPYSLPKIQVKLG